MRRTGRKRKVRMDNVGQGNILSYCDSPLTIAFNLSFSFWLTNWGRLYCHVEKSRLGDVRGTLEFHLRGLDMKNVEPGFFGLGRSDPFFEVAKKNSDHSIGQTKWNVVYRSEHIENNLNPYWTPCVIGLEELCYCDLNWPLKITIWDHNDNGKHTVIGEFETTIEQLQERISIKGNADREQAIPLSQEKKLKTYGLVVVLKATIKKEGNP